MGKGQYQVTEKDNQLRTRSSSIENKRKSRELAKKWLEEYPDSEIQLFDEVVHDNARASPRTERRRSRELITDWRKDLLTMNHKNKLRDMSTRRQSDVVPGIQIPKLKPRSVSDVSHPAKRQYIPRSRTMDRFKK